MTARQFTHEELEHLTRYWCRTQGIHLKDIEAHPQIDDVIILITFLKEYVNELKDSKRIHLAILWDWVYKQKKALTKRQCKQLTRLINQLEATRYHKKRRLDQKRNRIRQLRTQPTLG